MNEKKEFKKKQLNKEDYKIDEKIVGTLKKVGGTLGVLVIAGISVIIKGKFDNNEKD